jgi:SAM-dependent methyltransferase
MNLRKLIQYNLWYYQKPPWDSGISPPELLEFIQRQRPGRALDLGCGSGTNAITLAKNGWQATGVDFAWRAIQMAKRKAKKAGVRADFRVGDVSRLPGITGAFDLILDIGCFHSLSAENRQEYRRNLERLLAPGGTFMLYGFVKNPAMPRPGIVEEDIQDFSTLLELISRQEGSDTARGGKSVWLSWRKSLGGMDRTGRG